MAVSLSAFALSVQLKKLRRATAKKSLKLCDRLLPNAGTGSGFFFNLSKVNTMSAPETMKSTVIDFSILGFSGEIQYAIENLKTLLEILPHSDEDQSQLMSDDQKDALKRVSLHLSQATKAADCFLFLD